MHKAVGLYLSYLRKISGPGNNLVAEECERLGWLLSYIEDKIEENRRLNKEDWMPVAHQFDNKDLGIIKSTLFLLKEKIEREIDDAIAIGKPEIAVEGLRSKIEDIEKLMTWPVIQQAETYTLLVKGPVPAQNVTAPGTVTIHATIHNRDGVVAVGKDIQIHQQFVALSSLLNDFMTKADQDSRLDQDQKDELRANVTTIQTQLSLRKPNATIISTAWQVIQAIVTAEGLIQFLTRIRPLIEPIIVATAISH